MNNAIPLPDFIAVCMLIILVGFSVIYKDVISKIDEKLNEVFPKNITPQFSYRVHFNSNNDKNRGTKCYVIFNNYTNKVQIYDYKSNSFRLFYSEEEVKEVVKEMNKLGASTT